MKKEVLLYTSGVDSYIARIYLMAHGHDFDCLYFDHGGRYCEVEKAKIKETKVPVIIDNRLKLKDLEEQSAFIPNRNILFTVMANSLGYEKIWIGGSKSDRVCDNNESVFEELSRFITMMSGKYCKIDSPFWNCYKDDMVTWFLRQAKKWTTEPSKELIGNTYSCFNPLSTIRENMALVKNIPIKYNTVECMACPACFRKCAVLNSGGIFIEFGDRSIVNKYYQEFENMLVLDARSIGTLEYIHRLNRVDKSPFYDQKPIENVPYTADTKFNGVTGRQER